MSVKNFRLYQPSLHLFNGLKADAEVIIEHKGVGRTILVCVPVTTSNTTSISSRFFHQFMPVIPTERNSKQSINVNKWSLNAVVPDAPFYFYIGPLPYPPCDGKNSIIVFGKDHGATMSDDDYDILKNSISSIKIKPKKRLKAIGESSTLIMMNKTGSQPPGGKNKGHVIFEDCQPIDGMGGKTKKDSPNQKGGDAPTILYILLLLLAVLALAAGIKWLCGAAGGGGGGGGEGTSGDSAIKISR